MRKFLICYPGDNDEPIEEILTEQDIIEQYYPYWSSKMIEKYGLKVFYTAFSPAQEYCIQDWMTIHWAKEL